MSIKIEEIKMHITIIGCGNMGSGIAKRLSMNHQISLYDHYPATAESLTKQIQATAYADLFSAIEEADLILVAVKPQNLDDLTERLAPLLKPHQTIVSILAGINYKTLKHRFSQSIVVRMMPNLALIHGKGVIGLVENDQLTDKLKMQLKALFDPLGSVYWLPESKIDALTALTGSGPAFIFALVESMIEAGIYMGFQMTDAKSLIFQMLKGSLALLETTDKHPADLKWQITSPAGMTIEGLKTFEDYGVRSGIIHTFLASFNKIKQVSDSLKN
ncbi:unnamed protein product [Candidatus Protochlamydia amoebophila UWE25]|uniref:Pyrroline-5-carboxylate reductase n=2 Tax=Candidatus Protochlamydia amoebophila TaxID=362787 RepID=A0A2P9H9U1_PARUW|nr:unnamed protein product [Candidatus Protochlamydia amoebophila UWE25]